MITDMLKAMSNKELLAGLKSLGLSPKAAKVYLANLALGETTILELSKESGVARTSIYYTIEELKDRGMLTETQRGKKTYYMYIEPETVLKDARQKIVSLDEILPELEELKWAEKRKPRVEFYFGPAGFKEVWMKVLHSEGEPYCIITAADHFSGYVKEKYIIDEIITEKKRRFKKSKQIILDSKEARNIVIKDEKENRQSKLLPSEYPLAFTEIITKEFVVFISRRLENIIFTIDHKGFAETRQALFNALWDGL
jgi:sugar-specific transcriptional regulator TrmB